MLRVCKRLGSVTLLAAIQATGLLAFTLTGLTPAEHTSLSWTYKMVRNFETWGYQVLFASTLKDKNSLKY